MGTTRKQLTGALLASAAIIAGAGSTAAAQENQAGEVVENVFTLDYSVGGTPQTGITNDTDNPNGRTVQGTETTFTVDRKVDLAVTSLTGGGFTNAPVPGQAGVPTFFSVVNEGNDDFQYVLAAAQDTGDNFDTTAPANQTANPTISWYVPASGVACQDTASLYTNESNTVSTDIPSGDAVCVRVLQDIDPDAQDGETGNVFLTATAAYPTNWTQEAALGGTTGQPVQSVGAAATNDIDGVAQNVFLDDAFGASGDAANNGEHAAQGTMVIASAKLTASKYVYAQATDGSGTGGCDAPTTPLASNAVENNQFFVPGACVVYVIRVANGGSSAAADIAINDALPDDVTFSDAGVSGALTLPSGQAPTSDAGCAAASAATCNVAIANGSLAASANGALVIAAIVD